MSLSVNRRSLPPPSQCTGASGGEECGSISESEVGRRKQELMGKCVLLAGKVTLPSFSIQHSTFSSSGYVFHKPWDRRRLLPGRTEHGVVAGEFSLKYCLLTFAVACRRPYSPWVGVAVIPPSCLKPLRMGLWLTGFSGYPQSLAVREQP